MFLLTAVAAGASPGAATFTTMHLILIAILIVLVIAAILWGARQKRERSAGEREEAKRTEALLAHPQTETAVSPAPPPLGDSGLGAAMPQPVVEKPKAATKAAAPAPKEPPAKAAVKPKVAPKPAAKAAVAKPAAKVASSKAPATKAVPATKPVVKAAPAKTPVAKAAPAPKPATPKAAAAKPAAKSKTAAPAPAASAYGLIDVKGLGPKAMPLLEAQGVGDLAALAALSPARAAEIDAGLGALSGRMARDRWIEQAKLLAAGNVAEFEATYGKL